MKMNSSVVLHVHICTYRKLHVCIVCIIRRNTYRYALCISCTYQYPIMHIYVSVCIVRICMYPKYPGSEIHIDTYNTYRYIEILTSKLIHTIHTHIHRYMPIDTVQPDTNRYIDTYRYIQG